MKSQNAASTATKTAKTNNYFPKVLRSNYNKTGSALVAGSKPDQIISQNGSPKTQSSPAQSLLTLPTGEPSTHDHIGSHGGGVSDVASVQNGKTNILKKEIIGIIRLNNWYLDWKLQFAKYLDDAQWNFQSGDLGDISATFVMSL